LPTFFLYFRLVFLIPSSYYFRLWNQWEFFLLFFYHFSPSFIHFSSPPSYSLSVFRLSFFIFILLTPVILVRVLVLLFLLVLILISDLESSHKPNISELLRWLWHSWTVELV
jgi:hypothetical protein